MTEVDDVIDAPLEDAPLAAPARRRVPARRQRSEADIGRACHDVLVHEYGGYGIKHWGGAHSVNGTPDHLACVRGRMVATEWKRPGERPTVAQMAQMRRWQDAGAHVSWVTNEEQMRDVLDRLDDPTWHNDFAVPGVPRA